MQIQQPNFSTMGKATLKNSRDSILFSFFLFTISLSTSTSLHHQSFLPLQNSQTTLNPSITKLPSPTSHITELPSATTLSLDLHHRDSLSNSEPETRLSLRLARDVARADLIINSVDLAVRPNATRAKKKQDISSSVVSGLAQGSGEYFTRLGVGTPPRYGYVVLDTGSDVFWVQCVPCKKCYSQSDPIFDPRKSSTYAHVGCSSPICKKLDSPGCDRSTGNCLYSLAYGDGSTSVGDLSIETLTFRKTLVKNVAIGCGHENKGIFAGAAGLMGLGRGKLSFPVQTGSLFGKKFSYCLVDLFSSNTSSLIFGDSAVSQKARFTPLLTNPNPLLNTYYYLGLTGISVGGQRLKGISSALFKLNNAGDGGVIIDSGTSVTRLTHPAYLALRNAFRARASDLKWSSNFSVFDTCFNLPAKKAVYVPTVSLHFTGVDMELPPSNILFPVDNKRKFCLAFAGTTSKMSIIGNFQQQSFRIIYDLVGDRVGFAPNGCA